MTDEEQALLQAVYDRPDEDAARLVYADWLLERGDPRGELIMLQCSTPRPAGPREVELLREHQDQWLGPLARCLERVEFTRGFPSRVRIDWQSTTRPWPIGSPAWATVESLSFLGPTSGADGQRLVTDPAMRSLREVHAPEGDLLLWLARHDPPLPFRRLSAQLMETDQLLQRSSDRGFALSPHFLDTLGDAPGLPHLEHLALSFVILDHGPSDPPPYVHQLLDHPLVARLDVLELGGWPGALGPMIAAAQHVRAAGPRTLRFHPANDGNWDCDLAFGREGRRSSLRARLTDRRYTAVEECIAALGGYLETVDASTLTALAIDVRGEWISDDSRGRLEALRRRFD